MTKTLLCAALVAGLIGAQGVQARDYEAGKKKAEEVCAACHGPDGNKSMTPDIPILAGQKFDYLLVALQQYHKGERNNPMMTPMAKPLTKDEMKNLAWYFSKQKGLSAKY